QLRVLMYLLRSLPMRATL
ncbi:D-isomer specific 2-hydroxyacid dehydrogenase, NAD binding domain protein, partial [Vibrio parahaemolyticus V-223/04]